MYLVSVVVTVLLLPTVAFAQLPEVDSLVAQFLEADVRPVWLWAS